MYNRREVLQYGALAAVGGLAGCQGTPGDATETPTPIAPDYGGWLDETDNFDGTTVDKRGQDTVTIDVGVEGNNGNFAFGPPAVWIDPGTTVRWEWTGDGGAHNVVAESGASFSSGEATAAADTTFEHTFEQQGTVTYFCKPHRSLGMRGALVVGDPDAAASTTQAYDWDAATWDSYWYSLYNMSTNIAMSGNGVQFPATEAQRETFNKRQPAITEHADVDGPPVKNPNLNMAPFTTGDPSFTQQSVLSGDDGRPNADTLAWDTSKSSGVVSPASLAWTHLKGVTWAKNFENHFDTLPTESIAPKFRAQILSTLAQLGTKFALVDGKLRANNENMRLVAGFRPRDGTVVDDSARPADHAAMTWFLSDLVSLAEGDWFGYVNPKPLIPQPKLRTLADGMFKTTMSQFDPDTVLETATTRELGLLLGATGWYGTHAGSPDLEGMAATYANSLADAVGGNLAGNGKVEQGASNQAATQGVVAQGLAWASEIPDVDRTDAAGDVAGYLFDELWDDQAGTFATGADADTYSITARDAGDIIGGINAADVVLGRDDAKETFAGFFDGTVNRGRLQRAQRPPSAQESDPNPLPLPPKAGGEYGQAAVSNAAVEYDTAAGEWAVTDETFVTAEALYLANQEIWTSQWGGDFFEGRGVPGTNDEPL
jgi:halocyanin-like protein